MNYIINEVKIIILFIIMENKILLLFDVDGTLTEPRKKISIEMLDILKQLNKNSNIDLGFVGGSDLNKQIEQLDRINFNLFRWQFSENGLVAFENNVLFNKANIINELGEENFQKLINVCLKALSEIKIPIKRGHFLELRQGMINISPIGRSCSVDEREEFYNYDKINHIRLNLIEKIQNELIDFNLQFAIGGQISIDIFPKGWDKTFCLQFIENKYKQIYFFGDKTLPGGNDFEIYNDSRVIGKSVENYNDTILYLKTFL